MVIKLNGELGSSMGWDKAKSLLEVKQGNTFLDMITKQIIDMRKKCGNIKFILMNSFSSSVDTLEFLSRYPSVIADHNIELLQSKVPKIDQRTMQPVEWPSNRELEWCPPGHGDIYSILYNSGKLDKLLEQGIKYMFVSNCDNLGATLDLDLLTYFAKGNLPFLMECCKRTDADKKDGHLAMRVSDKQLILRESNQCSTTDETLFQDIQLHKYCNTNNIWVRLDVLKRLIQEKGGFIYLPTVFNSTTVDPQVEMSNKVFQLETSVGAAIECFVGAGAICVPRSRFVTAKKCSDLLLLRSDAYVINPRGEVVLNPVCKLVPIVDLENCKFIQQLDELTMNGYPSLVHCEKLKIFGEVCLSSRNKFVGVVSVVNRSGQRRGVPAGKYENCEIDVSDIPSMGALRIYDVPTVAFLDQRPGTSGLRKKTKRFQETYYLHNFIQATFNALKHLSIDVTEGALLVGGDGRYYNNFSIQVIIRMAFANGVRRVIIGENGLLSSPAVSSIIRERGPLHHKCFGAFILTASHNPGGPNEDFGIKYNCGNGGPAPEAVTNLIYKYSTKITSLKICNDLPVIDISVKDEIYNFTSPDGSKEVNVEVISSTFHHIQLLKTIFDFSELRKLVSRCDFRMVYDCMHGVQGPYAFELFVNELGLPISSLINSTPKEDFNGGHADPNLVYARDICDIMGVDKCGLAQASTTGGSIPCFGAAADGDAERNMILGKQFFVTPSDSLAIIAAHAEIIPFFSLQGGLKCVARSMPTSCAVDRVASRNNLKCFEVPSGWKFFGNLMDSKV